VGDLALDGRVRPVEIQLVGEALFRAEVKNYLDYERAGRAAGLLADYLGLVLKSVARRLTFLRRALPKGMNFEGLWYLTEVYVRALSPKRSFSGLYMRDAQRVLLTLIDEPKRRLALTAREITRRVGQKPGEARYVQDMLEALLPVHLVRRAVEETAEKPAEAGEPDQNTRYELTHDVLMDFVLNATREFREHRALANRILGRALQDAWRTVRYRDWDLITAYADPEEVKRPQARALLRRSLIWWLVKWFVLLPVCVVAALSLLQCNSGKLTTKQDYADRVVIRRGLPWLGFLPVIGDDVILDTGFVYGELDRKQADHLEPPIHWQWDHRQSGMLAEDRFIEMLRNRVDQGELLCQLGREDEGLQILGQELAQGDKPSRGETATRLANVSYVNPERAGWVVDTLLTEMARPDWFSRRSDREPWNRVKDSFKGAARANPRQAIQPLIQYLNSHNNDGRIAVIETLPWLVRQDPAQGRDVLAVLRTLLSDPSRVSDEAEIALGKVARANPALADECLKVLEPQLKHPRFEDRFEHDRPPSLFDIRESVQELIFPVTGEAISEVVQADPKHLAPRALAMLKPLLSHEHLGTRWQATMAVGQLVRVCPFLGQDALNALKPKIDISEIFFIRHTAAIAVGWAARSNPTSARDAWEVLEPLTRDRYYDVEAAAAHALVLVSRADNKRADYARKAVEPLLMEDNKFVCKSAVTALGDIVRANPGLSDKILKALKPLLENKSWPVKSAVASALGRVAIAAPNRAPKVLKVLQPLCTDTNEDVRLAATMSIGDAAGADADSATDAKQVLEPLLTDSVDAVRIAAAKALAEAARSDPQQAGAIYEKLETALTDKRKRSPEFAQGTADSLGQVAQAIPAFRARAFSLLVDYDDVVSQAMQAPLARLLVVMADEEAANGGNPAQFLLNHLVGKRSALSGFDANTHAVYRRVAVGAVAEWLAARPKDQDGLRAQLQELRQGQDIHLRIAAWKILAQAVQLQLKSDADKNSSPGS
jgi:hypothetical protein